MVFLPRQKPMSFLKAKKSKSSYKMEHIIKLENDPFAIMSTHMKERDKNCES